MFCIEEGPLQVSPNLLDITGGHDVNFSIGWFAKLIRCGGADHFTLCVWFQLKLIFMRVPIILAWRFSLSFSGNILFKFHPKQPRCYHTHKPSWVSSLSPPSVGPVLLQWFIDGPSAGVGLFWHRNHICDRPETVGVFSWCPQNPCCEDASPWLVGLSAWLDDTDVWLGA